MTQSRRIRPPGGPSRRRGLAADTLVILAGALLAILASRVLVPDAALTAPSSLPGDSENVIGIASQPANPTLPALATLGPPVNASAGLGATPTPIPIITLGPPTPSPSDSIEPSGSTKPTPKPTLPPAIAGFNCLVVDLTLTCTNTSSNATAWDWDWGDGTPDSNLQKPPPHTYLSPNTYRVTLTVHPLGLRSVHYQDFPMTAPSP